MAPVVQGETTKLARSISLGVLLVLVVVIGILSFEVMATFILPLFLAAMLAVLFQPIQVALTRKLKNRPRPAAALTTTLVLLSVLLPSLMIGGLAVSEAASLVDSLDRDDLARKFGTLRNRLSLGPPPAPVMAALERIRTNVGQLEDRPYVEPDAATKLPSIEELQSQIEADVQVVEERLHLGKVPAGADVPAPPAQLATAWSNWLTSLRTPKPPQADANHAAWQNARGQLEQFQTELLGGPLVAPIKRFVRLDNEQLDGILAKARSAAAPLAIDTTQFVGGLLWQLTVGFVIVLLGVYYFLADGSSMLQSLIELTPLDRKHTETILADFGNLTRAIVLSMVLAALAQGLLAGAGYLFVGLGSVFLLTLMTILFAMVPLVGATLVWGGACLWLYFIEQRTGAAIGLAVYCAVVVSLADNLIKPLVLQERSNLHPLPALLSVLGGAQALGPIGVFVGPMVLALLHTLLVMLRGEMKGWEQKRT